MAEATEYTMGARANCSDGFCGEVTGMIIDPAARMITHLVVEPKHRRQPGRLVPLELIDSARGEIRLRCSVAEFDRLDLAEQTEFVQEDGGGDLSGEAGPVQGAGGGPLSGMGTPIGIPHAARTTVQDAVPKGEMEVGHDEGVHALDGEVGRIRGFLLDPGTGQVTHVLLQEGHLWGRKEVAIPMSAVKGIDYGVRLNITKQQVGDLPAGDIEHPDGS
jgi:sporulation protein YlmC with PRC-barrel domain